MFEYKSVALHIDRSAGWGTEALPDLWPIWQTCHFDASLYAVRPEVWPDKACMDRSQAYRVRNADCIWQLALHHLSSAYMPCHPDTNLFDACLDSQPGKTS